MGTLFRAWRKRTVCCAAGGGGRLASDCGVDELQILLSHRARSRDSSGGNVPVSRLCPDERSAQESVLLLVVSGGNFLGEPVEDRAPDFRAQSSAAEMG